MYIISTLLFVVVAVLGISATPVAVIASLTFEFPFFLLRIIITSVVALESGTATLLDSEPVMRVYLGLATLDYLKMALIGRVFAEYTGGGREAFAWSGFFACSLNAPEFSLLTPEFWTDFSVNLALKACFIGSFGLATARGIYETGIFHKMYDIYKRGKAAKKAHNDLKKAQNEFKTGKVDESKTDDKKKKKEDKKKLGTAPNLPTAMMQEAAVDVGVEA